MFFIGGKKFSQFLSVHLVTINSPPLPQLFKNCVVFLHLLHNMQEKTLKHKLKLLGRTYFFISK